MKYTTNQQVINLSNGPKTLSRSTSSRSADLSNGFSAVELLITLFIAAAFLISGFQLYAVIIKDGGEARMQSSASNVATDYLQRYKSSATNPCTTQSPLTDSSISIPGLSSVTVSVAITCPYVVATASECTGGTKTPDGAYTVHKFTAGGTLTCTSSFNASVLVVGGGGSGGAAGGGAGGAVYSPNISMSTGPYTIIVGSGGASWDVTGGNTGGYHGGSSSISIPGINTAKGGQGGFGWDYQPTTTMDIWGSGAGSPQSSTGPYVSGGYTNGQGFPGGPDPDMNNSPFPSGGGGGAGGAGIKAGGVSSSDTINGNGGVGIDMSATFGTAYGQNGWFAGGGGGSCHLEGCSASSGGNGGGGGVNAGCVSGTAGTPNTGGGGGGGMNCGSSVSGAGGSGIVIIRYPTPVPSITSVSKILVTVKYGTPQQTITNATYVKP